MVADVRTVSLGVVVTGEEPRGLPAQGAAGFSSGSWLDRCVHVVEWHRDATFLCSQKPPAGSCVTPRRLSFQGHSTVDRPCLFLLLDALGRGPGMVLFSVTQEWTNGRWGREKEDWGLRSWAEVKGAELFISAMLETEARLRVLQASAPLVLHAQLSTRPLVSKRRSWLAWPRAGQWTPLSQMRL